MNTGVMVSMTDDPGGDVPSVVGLDVGSTTAKIAVPTAIPTDGADEGESPGFRTKMVQAHHWKELYGEITDRSRTRIVSTGYFRRSVPHDLPVTEITAAIHGVAHFFPDADLIIDIGGQDVKVIDPRSGDFQLNDKCSAGTGAFLELVARYFEIPVENLAELHNRARRTAPVNQTCGVFAVSEMISRMVEGYTMEEVIAGVHHAFARRISFMVDSDAEVIVTIGGVSKNGGIISTLSEVLGKEVITPGDPQIVNAVGAARYGMKYGMKIRESSM